MKVTCHFEFSGFLQDPDVYGDLFEKNENNLFFILMYEIYNKLKKKYPHFSINCENSWHTAEDGPKKPQYDKALFVIENPITQKFIAFSMYDKIRYLVELKEVSDNCIEYLPSWGIHWDDCRYEQIPNFKYTPVSAITHYALSYHQIEKSYKENVANDKRIFPDKIYFRANAWGVRDLLKKASDKVCLKQGRISGNDFIDELNKYNVNFDINAVAEVSCRTFDIMGLGGALIRPELTIQYHNKLIPNYHYAAIKGNFVYEDQNGKEIVEAYLDRLEDLRKDPDFVRFLSENGRKWYEENCTIENCSQIIVDRIDLNKLFN